MYVLSGELIQLLTMSAVFLYMTRNNLDFLYNRTQWAAASIFFCCAMASGQMWNHIEKPQLGFIDRSSTTQHVLESYIIMVLYALVVVSMIFLGEEARRKRDPKMKQALVILSIVLMSVFYSAILAIFNLKSPQYPFRYLFTFYED